MRFFAMARTFNEARLAILEGMVRSLFLLTSRISSDVISRIWVGQYGGGGNREEGEEEGLATHSIGDLAHGIVAHVEVAEALALDEARWEGGQQVVREGEPGEVN